AIVAQEADLAQLRRRCRARCIEELAGRHVDVHDERELLPHHRIPDHVLVAHRLANTLEEDAEGELQHAPLPFELRGVELPHEAGARTRRTCRMKEWMLRAREPQIRVQAP